MDRTRRRQRSDLRQFVFLEPPPNGMLIESLGWKFDKERKSPSYDLCHESCRRTYILRGVGSIQMVGLRSADVGQGYLNKHQCCCCCPIQSILHGRETDGRTMVNNGINIRRWTGFNCGKERTFFAISHHNTMQQKLLANETNCHCD